MGQLALLDVEGHVVDMRACRGEEIFVSCATIHFPCHVARLDEKIASDTLTYSIPAHGDGWRLDGVPTQQSVPLPLQHLQLAPPLSVSLDPALPLHVVAPLSNQEEKMSMIAGREE